MASDQRKKTQGGGGVQFEILRNPGIDFYSGLKKNPGIHFIVASEKKKHKGGCNSKS